jgi:hypothetical protein
VAPVMGAVMVVEVVEEIDRGRNIVRHGVPCMERPCAG